MDWSSEMWLRNFMASVLQRRIVPEPGAQDDLVAGSQNMMDCKRMGGPMLWESDEANIYI